MRILFDSKKESFKSPFGTLIPHQVCRLHIHIPASVETTRVVCLLHREDGTPAKEVPMTRCDVLGAYEVFGGSFAYLHGLPKMTL